MPSTALWENDRWRVVLPELPLTLGHLAIIDKAPTLDVDAAGADAVLDAYRRVGSALWHAGGYRGFQLVFADAWEPDQDAIGEPDPVDREPRVIHVFGRGSADDALSAVRLMAIRRKDREYAAVSAPKIAALAAAVASGETVEVAGPADQGCDGCTPDVLTRQERWRHEGVRVIRPKSVLIDSQVIVLPLRHVVSFGDLTAAEVASLFARLREVRDQFNQASEVTGLSCFANDGVAARQETPHVHLHVFGRSRQEGENPFVLLGRAR